MNLLLKDKFEKQKQELIEEVTRFSKEIQQFRMQRKEENEIFKNQYDDAFKRLEMERNTFLIAKKEFENRKLETMENEGINN